MQKYAQLFQSLLNKKHWPLLDTSMVLKPPESKVISLSYVTLAKTDRPAQAKNYAQNLQKCLYYVWQKFICV